jgi:hypothetical protein
MMGRDRAERGRLSSGLLFLVVVIVILVLVGGLLLTTIVVLPAVERQEEDRQGRDTAEVLLRPLAVHQASVILREVRRPKNLSE